MNYIKKSRIVKFFMIVFLFMFGFKTIVLADTTLDCDSWGNLQKDFQNVFNFMKIVIPLLIIGLSSVDFIKAITGKDDKNLKKAFHTLIKRFVLAVIFFFLPSLIDLLLQMIGRRSPICLD